MARQTKHDLIEAIADKLNLDKDQHLTEIDGSYNNGNLTYHKKVAEALDIEVEPRTTPGRKGK